MKTFLLQLLVTASSLPFIVGLAHAQTNALNVFVSSVDQDLAIKSIALIPVTDNVGGIYAKPTEEELREILNDDKQWSLSSYPDRLKVKTEGLEDRASDVQKILQTTQSEAALNARLIKGPRGISITMTLFVGRDGLPLLQETLTDFKGFEISEIKAEVRRMFESLKYRMPFRANIVSRRGQQVTLNLGSSYGLKNESRVSVVQIIKVHRHPKLNFMVSTEKEVLGRVKLFKVEPFMSFGFVEMEKEPGVIGVGAKVMPDEFVKYSLPVTTPSGRVMQDITMRPDKDVAFGDEPQEWVPSQPPQFGKIELLGGISSYSQNVKLETAGAVSGNANMAPNIMARGELWLNPEWLMGFQLRQSAFSVDNTLSGSSPGALSMAMSQYGIHVGYNFILTEDFFGPKLQVGAGYLNTNFNVDDSAPTAFTSMAYGGLMLRLAGQVPLSAEVPIDLGGKLDFFFSPGLSENISSGSSSSNEINNFSFFLDYKLKARMKIRGELMFENFSSGFSGVGKRSDAATSISHKTTTLMGGVQFYF